MDRIRLGDACEILNGYAFRSENYVESGIRVIRISNVQKGYIEDNTPAYYPLDSNGLDRFMLEEGDLLMSLTGNVGRVAILEKKNLKEIFEKHLGIAPGLLDSVKYIDQLDSIIEFRGEIVHQVKAATYVHIEDVKQDIQVINEIVIGIDTLIREHIKNTYNVKVPWNDTYTHIG